MHLFPLTRWNRWVVILLVLGLFFRFYQLDYKFYWLDEAFTSLRISGFTEAELVQRLSQGNWSVADLQLYQYPNAEKTIGDVVRSLAQEEPQHPPLYFVIAHFYLHLFPSTVAATRSLSALISLFTFPALYWLCMELFASTQVSSLAVALLAVSPFHILYAQEAREYSLWMVMIIGSTALLVRSLRLHQIHSWVLYALSLALGLYTFPATVMLMVAHGGYVLLCRRRETDEDTNSIANRIPDRSAYGWATAAGLLLFSPWLFVLLTRTAQVDKTFVRMGRVPIPSLVKTWAFNICRLFIDYSDYERQVDYGGLKTSHFYGIQIAIVIVVNLLVFYAFFILYRYTSRRIWLLIGLMAATALPVMITNLVSGGAQSLILRYLMPYCIAIQIAVAYLLSHHLQRSGQRYGWRTITVVLIMGGLLSGWVSSQSSFWWTKSQSDMTFQWASVINQAPQPIVVSDAAMGQILAFSHALSPQVRVQLAPRCGTCAVTAAAIAPRNLTQLPAHVTDGFLFNPSPALLEQFSQPPFQVRSLYRDPVYPQEQILQFQIPEGAQSSRA